MRLKVDENLPAQLADLLKSHGHDVATVVQQGLGGAEDREVLGAAREEDRILLTLDTDFGNILDYPVGTHAGIVVFRLQDQRWPALEEPARRLLRAGVLERLKGGLAVVDESKIRMRAGGQQEDAPLTM